MRRELLLPLVALALLPGIVLGEQADKRSQKLEKELAKISKTLASDPEASTRLRAVLGQEANVPVLQLSEQETAGRVTPAELYLLHSLANLADGDVEAVLARWQESGRKWAALAERLQVPFEQLEWKVEEVRGLVEDQARPAPGFAVNRLDGQTLRLEECRGKIVILEFWATWCQQCMAQLPEFEELYRTYRERGVEFLAVSVDQEREKVPPMLAKKSWTFPVAYLTAELNDGYGGRGTPIGTPAIYMVDQRGLVRFFHSRYNPSLRARLESKINALLKEAERRSPGR